MESFSYSLVPIEQREIRILELFPSRSSTQAIDANLSLAHLDDLPSFTALSYVWGDEQDRADIIVNGFGLSITKNLDTALKALRSQFSTELLWIDQICINQHDNAEKSRQIPLMGDIYSRSTRTVGWLGEEHGQSDKAMRYLQDVGSQAENLGLANLEQSQLTLLLAKEEDIQAGMVEISEANADMRKAVYDMVASMGSFIGNPAIEGMIDLSHLGYFTRGWIQQEIAIPSKLVLQWGGHIIDASTFTAAIYFYLIFTQKRLLPEIIPMIEQDVAFMALFSRIQGAALWTHTLASLELRNIYHSPNRRKILTVARILGRLRRVIFSQPQDRIYGILGIASDKDKLDLQVDVGRSMADVFTGVAKRIINSPVTDTQSVEGVNFLSLVATPAHPDLPTWVPDLTRLGAFETLANRTATLTTSYHASAGVEHTPIQNHANTHVACRGIIVDIISKTGPSWPTDESGQPKHEGGLDCLASIEDFTSASQVLVNSNAASRHPFRNNPQRLDEARWRIPVLNRESVSETGAAREATSGWSKIGWNMAKYTMNYDQHMHDIWKVISEVPLSPEETVELGKVLDADRLLEEVKLKMLKNAEYHKRPERIIYGLLLNALRDRKPFLGADGFVGIGPVEMQREDLVCVLHGGSFPFVLRRTHDAGVYNLVGEAYCDGIMAGEGLRMGLPVLEFVLA